MFRQTKVLVGLRDSEYILAEINEVRTGGKLKRELLMTRKRKRKGKIEGQV